MASTKVRSTGESVLSQSTRARFRTVRVGIGAPDIGDPRIWLKPGQVKGRTVFPLNKQPDSMQAWKIVIPTSKVLPEPRAHDGHEWLYVLSGQMRLVLVDKNWVLGPGEIPEIDTQVLHWFGSTGQHRQRSSAFSVDLGSA